MIRENATYLHAWSWPIASQRRGFALQCFSFYCVQNSTTTELPCNSTHTTSQTNSKPNINAAHGVNAPPSILFVCVFVDTKTSSLSETGQFMSSTYYVPVRNRKILASTYLTNESVRQGAEKSRLKIFFALLKSLFNIVDPCQKNDYYQSGRS